MKTLPTIVVLCLMSSTPLFAQKLSQVEQTDVTAASMAAATGAANASIVKAAPAISLEGSQDDKIVRAQIGLQYRRVAFSVGAKTPVSKSNDATTLADLDGLRDKTTGEFAIYASRWLGMPTDPAGALDAPCKQYAEETGKTEGKDFRCRLGWFKQDTSAAGRRAYNAILKAVSPPQIVFYGINGSISPEAFDFLDKSTLSSGTEKHTSWALAGVGGIVFRTNTVLTGSYRRERTYNAGDSSQICVPISGTNGLSCSEKILGGPGDPTVANVVSVEAKHFFGGSFALAPKISYDWTKRVTGIEVPIYVLQDKNGGLTGGITLGWRSDKKQFTAAAFVGPVLRLITKN